MQKKYLLWDFDNTLAYRDGMWSHTIYTLLGEYGYKDIAYEDIRPFLKTGFPWNHPELPHSVFFNGAAWWDHMTQHFAKVIEQLGVQNQEAAKEIAGRIKKRYLDVNQWYLYEDALFCLKKAIYKGYENIMLSNHVPELHDLVKALGIYDYFVQIHTSADLGYEKPHVEAYRRVIDALEQPSSVTMIGDNYHADVIGAQQAGIDAILVRKENEQQYAKYARNLEEIFQFLL